MSKLKVEDLKKLSVKQLENYITGLDGEDKILAEKVLATKTAGVSEVEKDDKVKTEIDTSKAKAEAKVEEAKKRAEAREAARIEKENVAKAKAEEREVAAKTREEERDAARKVKEEVKTAKEVEREKAREDAKVAKAAKAEEREEAKKAKEAEKEAKVEAKAKTKADKLEKLKAEALEKEKAKLQAKEDEKAHAMAIAERMKGMVSGTPAINKSQQVRDCVAQGMTNAEIEVATGFGRKFICDTTWRIQRQLEKAEAEAAAAVESVKKED